MAASAYSVLVVAIVASVVAGNPQTVGPSVATTEAVMSCDCVTKINAEVMPNVNTFINELTTSVDELFKQANATGISPVSVRFACFFCKKIRKRRRQVHAWHFNTHHYRKCYHCHHQGKRQAGRFQAANIPVCPISEVIAVAQSAREGTQLVKEVLAGIRTDPKEVNQDLLDDVTALYNEVNHSVRNLQIAVNPYTSECQGDSDVAFPGEG